jgi:tight adherence protein C
MFEFIADRVNDPHFMFSLLLAVAVAATVLTIAMPLLVSDTLDKRMKAVSIERDRIRSRERERLQTKSSRVSLRQEPRVFMKQIVDSFNLSRWLGTDQAKTLLAQAGYRGQQAEIAFLFFRLILPIALFFLTLFYLFVIAPFDYPAMMRIGVAVFAAYLGIKTPEIFLKNTIQKRRLSMRRAFPDALDLLLICVESGNSIEHAFRKVSAEIGSSSIPLAEEFTLTTAELSYLQDRRVAYENLGLRTGLDSIRQVVTVLIQSERYGTPLGSALRVASQESRDARLMEAEKKAAALPPKLTVPMIIFFLPVLFAVILTPAIVQVMAVNK